MAEYIDRQKVFDSLPVVTDDKTISLYGAVADFMILVSAIPAEDVAPVRHGRWVLGTVEPGYLTPGGNRPWICSECKQVISWSLGRPYENYCHNCGAKMDKGGTDEAD